MAAFPIQPKPSAFFGGVKISLADFEKFDKPGLRKYLDDFLNEPDWGADQAEFEYLIAQFLPLLDASRADTFFLLNSPYHEASERVWMESGLNYYVYYFQILWIDRLTQKLTLVEWVYD